MLHREATRQGPHTKKTQAVHTRLIQLGEDTQEFIKVHLGMALLAVFAVYAQVMYRVYNRKQDSVVFDH